MTSNPDGGQVRTRSSERSAARGSVLREAQTVLGAHVEVIGSWRSGEFHLDSHASRSFSDLDAYDPLGTTHQERQMRVRIGPHMHDFRVSVHPENYESRLLPMGRVLMALLNLERCHRLSPGLRNYVQAKSYLVLAAGGSDSTYALMAGLAEFGEVALAVKTGQAPPEAISSPEFEFRLEALATDAAAEIGCDNLHCVSDLDFASSRTGISQRFANYLRRKYAQPPT